MPIYEYTCQDCGKEFEELVFKSDERPPCPGCASANTDKRMSCCSFKTAGAAPGTSKGPAAASGGSSCSGCSGKSCATCH